MNPLLLLLGSAMAALPLAAAEFKFGNQTFTLPDGFEMERVAGPPLVNRPIMADFDEQGRLYVADSSGSTDKVEKQLAERPHRIVRLTDTDGDGRFDQSTVFADKMMFPEGILWFEGAVYCGAPPSIWKLEDKDDDGVADQRTEWFKGGTLTGCANDLHGPYAGPDGLIYWCKGAFAQQTHERPGRKTISDRAAHIFRSRADGSEFDSVMSGGMDNPVEIAFTPAGETIFSTTFYTNPEGGRRDALVHAVYGGVYPKVHDVLDGLTRTGDLLPAMTHLGPAVPSGLMRYSSRFLSADFENNLFSCQFNLHRVQRHVLEPFGSTFRTRDVDFVVSDSLDFHPTDVLEDADGSLLIIDTGGWYKLCCPTSQIAKPDVLGAIYRVRRTGMQPVKDPRGLSIPWKSQNARALARLLDDPRPAVRSRAIAQLGKDEEAIPVLRQILESGRAKSGANPERASALTRLNTIWALTRMQSPAAAAAIRLALDESDPVVRQAAVYSAGLRRDQEAVPALIKILLTSGSLHLQRNAATSLGRIGDATAAPALLQVAAEERDRILEHSLIYALIEINHPASTRKGLAAASAFTRRTALIALDQMENQLAASEVVPLLGSANSVLKETAMWITGRHADWGSELSDSLRERLSTAAASGSEKDGLQRQLAQLARSPAIQQLIARQLAATPGARELLLRAIAQASLKEMPAAWNEELRRLLGDGSDAIVQATIAALRALPIAKSAVGDTGEALLKVARETRRSDELRLEAFSAAPTGFELEPALFDFLTAQLDPSKPPLRRGAAASAISRARLTEAQLLAVTELVRNAGPLELSRLLGAFDNATDAAVGTKLIESLKQSKGVSTLRRDAIAAHLAKFPAAVQEQGQQFAATLDANAAKQRERLDQLSGKMTGGDVRRGQKIFNSTQAGCATCHAIGYLGGHVGPDLTRIGNVRSERDLLESILYPSASFVRNFEPVIVTTKSGEDHAGVIRRETSETILLVSGPTAEESLPRAEVAAIRPGTVSIMPEGLETQLSGAELADLVTFLKSLK